MSTNADHPNGTYRLRSFGKPIMGLNLATLKLIPRLLENCMPQLVPVTVSDNRVHTSLQRIRGQMHKNEGNAIMKTAKGDQN